MSTFLSHINRKLGYLRRQWLAPGRLRRSRSSIERVVAANSPQNCKSTQEIMDELQVLIRTRHVLPVRDLLKDYFKMGLHRRGANPADYVFMNEYKQAVYPLMEQVPADVMALTDDKKRHTALFRAHGFRTPLTLGMLRLNAAGEPVVLPEEGGQALPLLTLLQEHQALFCKPVSECAGKGCALLEVAAHEGALMVGGRETSVADFVSACGLADASQLLVQNVIRQHEVLSSLHSASLNTLRLWSIWEEHGPAYFQGVLRMGRGGACVDNAGQGGMFVSILPDGTLGRLASCYADFSLETFTEHPDSHVVFEGLRLPFFEEATQMICAAHRLFPRELFDLAWDIAITPDGPLIVEVNSNGGTTMMQRVCGGWQQLMRDRLRPAILAGQRKRP